MGSTGMRRVPCWGRFGSLNGCSGVDTGSASRLEGVLERHRRDWGREVGVAARVRRQTRLAPLEARRVIEAAIVARVMSKGKGRREEWGGV